jgi:putative transposase
LLRFGNLDEKGCPIPVLAYCLVPTHWHFVLWPQRNGQLDEFLRWLTLTHSVPWQAHDHAVGSGHVYQNRFEAFPVESDDHLYTVLRYVERNAPRSGLVQRAEDWRGSSLAARLLGKGASQRPCPWPVPEPKNSISWVAKP